MPFKANRNQLNSHSRQKTQESLLDSKLDPTGEAVELSATPASSLNSDGCSFNDEKLALPPNRTAAGGSNKATARMLMLAAACSLGFFTLGYQLIVLNGQGVIVEAWINTSYVQRGYNYSVVARTPDSTVNVATFPGLSPDAVRFLYAVTTGALAAGAIIGAMFAGPIADRIGRRNGQLILAGLALTGAILGGISGYVFYPELLMCARVIAGISCGAATALAPMYLSEASPLAIRGSLSTLTQMGGCTGLFLCQIIGLPDFLGTERGWPMLFFLAALAPMLQILLTLFSPESPRYLYINRGEKLEAIKALKKLRAAPVGDDFGSELEDELAMYESEAEVSRQTPKVSISQLFDDRKYLWPLSVAVVMQLSQQWSGINGIVGYSNILFQRAGVAAESVGYANLSIGVISITTAVALTILIDRLGRRALHLGSLVGMIVFGVLIVIFSKLPQVYPRTEDNAATFTFFNHANIASVLTFLTFYNTGPASIPWIIVPELFAQDARGPATSVCCFVNWFSSFVLFVSFPVLQQVLGVYVYVPFVIALVVFLVFLARYMPETKGKSSEEIRAIFQKY